MWRLLCLSHGASHTILNCGGTADPSVLLDAACHQVLVKHCGALTLAASPGALAPAHMQALCSLTALTALEFEVTHDVRQWPSDSHLHLPQDLTRLTKLQKMTALSFPALPSDFSRLQHLCNLHLAPSEPIPHDLSTHTLLTRLHVGTGHAEMCLPLALPMGPHVCLQTLILHTYCQLQNLGTARSSGTLRSCLNQASACCVMGPFRPLCLI